MSRRDGNVRLSIIVPYLGADGSFEDTLISILENRPVGAEVIVAHDGSYSDPFELSDEVRFAVAASNSLPLLMAVAAQEARGSWVHVIANGVRATNGWTEPALELFQQSDVGIVAPLAISRNDDLMVSAGWASSWTFGTSPLGLGRSRLSRKDPLRVRGACLAASFWNRSLLQQVYAAYPTNNVSAAQYAWAQLITQQGWKVRLASESVVLAELSMLALTPGFAKGRTERELQRRLSQQSLPASALATGCATVLSSFRPSLWSNCAGQMLGALLPRSATFDIEKIIAPGDELPSSIRMPSTAPEAGYSVRAA